MNVLFCAWYLLDVLDMSLLQWTVSQDFCLGFFISPASTAYFFLNFPPQHLPFCIFFSCRERIFLGVILLILYYCIASCASIPEQNCTFMNSLESPIEVIDGQFRADVV
jgi:hypothetical protein